MNNVDLLLVVIELSDIFDGMRLRNAAIGLRSARMPSNRDIVAAYRKKIRSHTAPDPPSTISQCVMSGYQYVFADGYVTGQVVEGGDRISCQIDHVGTSGRYNFKPYNKYDEYSGYIYGSEVIGPQFRNGEVWICHNGHTVGRSKTHYVTLDRPTYLLC
jgi:hypothetical protein